ncbi:RlpA-like double-psi beta-barrel-protein domain-containing protein-containing protein [Podospora australis]|uniref:RlpA-like double-psi beta-barrel-protein domain-containing protein-containing protein n=1 Tax=Podospora australis TaxID=1536484 RepID=A0AAN6WNC2_9PEZI|nr:RlpA-like double-psi beta-barrel-protein domain-containing protein-containing protein [Podospora australis]
MEPTTTTAWTPSPGERIRHVPEWEVPVNYPAKRPFYSRVVKPYLPSRPLKDILFPRKPSTKSSAPEIAPAIASPSPVRDTGASISADESISKEAAISSGSGSGGGGAGGAILPTTTYDTISLQPERPTFRQRFDAILPPNKKYLRLPRKAFLIALAALIALVILALGLGLGLGLGWGLRSHHNAELPLPWTATGTKEQKGELTYFSPALGACGWMNTDSDTVAAVSHELYDAAAAEGQTNPNQNTLCGRWIRVWRDGEDKTRNGIDVQVVDRCTGCGVTDLDLTLGVFDRLADKDEGRILGGWEWLQ